MGKQSTGEIAACSFCGRTEDAVEKLVSGPNAFICDKCVRLCMDIVEKKAVKHELKPLKPQEIKSRLDSYVIGQEKAKRTIAVAVYTTINGSARSLVKVLKWSTANRMFFSLDQRGLEKL